MIGGFVQRLCAGTAPAGRRRVLAVDGKTLRGSRHVDDAGTELAGRHLLAVIDQHSRVVLGQTAVDATVEGKSSEIHQFTALLDTLTGLDLAGTVITADALHTQREQVADLHARGAHWVLTVKGNQPRLRRQLAEKRGASPGQLALAWVLAQGVTAIPGTKRRGYLEENVAAAGLTMDTGTLAALDEAIPAGDVAGERYIPAAMKAIQE